MSDAPPPVRRSSRRRTLLIVAALVAALAFALTVVATIATEAMWFGELRASNVFWTIVRTRVVLGVVFGAVFAALVVGNVLIARRLTEPGRAFQVPPQVFERYRAVLQPYLRRLGIGAALFAGAIAGLGASGKWREYQLWRHQAAFSGSGSVDPVFHKNLGFYFFKLPFIQFVYGWALTTLIFVAIVAALTYYVTGGIRPQRGGERVAPAVWAHLSVLVGIVVLLKAWGYRLGEYNLLYSNRGVVNGASYTDLHAGLPALKLLVIVAIVCAVLFFVNVHKKGLLLPLVSIGLLAATSFIGTGIVPAAMQRLTVKPDERRLEQPYLQRNIEATRTAFGLAGVEEIPFPAAGSLDTAAVEANLDTLANIRLWAPDVLQSASVNLQRIKQYYQFVTPADADRYDIGGATRELMLSAREISPNGLSANAKTWVNTHLFYTHGYAVVAARVDGVTAQGQPDFVVKDVPPVVAPGAPAVTTPQLYYGENEEVPFVVVDTKQGELDHPTGDRAGGAGYVTTDYDGTGGIRLGGIVRRAAFAWRFRDLNLLLSGAITNDSRIMFRRQIYSRVSQIAPFLQIDGDPYVAVVDGRLVWILDGYTTSSRYPYSPAINFSKVTGGLVAGSGNYIRNSVKFVVDAKNGTVDAYAWDETDPVLRAWMAVFPGLIKPRFSMPQAVVAHVRYPQGMFLIQSDRFADYHVKDAGTFYQREDAWLIGRDPTWCLNHSGACAAGAPPVSAYYMLTALPGEPGLQFVLVRPFTPAGGDRQNMVSYLVAHGDPGNYGRLVAYEFPRSQQTLGPEQVQASINQDPAVSQQVSLWNQQHSRVIYGNLLIVPMGDTFLYVQPLYLRGEGSQIPQLKRVVVFGNGNVEMGDTLSDALRLLLSRPNATS